MESHRVLLENALNELNEGFLECYSVLYEYEGRQGIELFTLGAPYRHHAEEYIRETMEKKFPGCKILEIRHRS